MQSPPKVLEQQCQFLCFSQYTEHSWGWDKQMSTEQEFRIPAFISWYVPLDVFNYLERRTFGIRSPNV